MKIFASFNSDLTIRAKSSSGGIFHALAKSVIDSGGVVYGAGYDHDWTVKHQRVDTCDDLPLLMGSKYVFSSFVESIGLVGQDLEARRKVLFSGTPCQVAAIEKKFGGSSNLILVEVICHGAPSPEYWNTYLAQLCQLLNRSVNDIDSVNFRDKRYGWRKFSLTIIFKDGYEFSEPLTKNLYIRAFLSNFTLRKACFRCPFKYPNGAKADITIGDLWGLTQIAPEIDNDLGMSVVITRTAQGDSFVEILQNVKSLELEQVEKYNCALTSSPALPLKWEETRRGLKNGENIISVFNKVTRIGVRESIFSLIYRIKNKLYRLLRLKQLSL